MQQAAESVTHELKCWPEFFKAIASGRKPFDVRKDDRGYQTGDTLKLEEWNPATQEYVDRTNRIMWCDVIYVYAGAGMQEGYVCMGIRVRTGPT